MIKNSKFLLESYLSELHDNMHSVLTTEPRRPGYETTLEQLSISGDYFPEKRELLALDDSAVAFFNNAAAFLQHHKLKTILAALPEQPMTEPLESGLIASGLEAVVRLAKKVTP